MVLPTLYFILEGILIAVYDTDKHTSLNASKDIHLGRVFYQCGMCGPLFPENSPVIRCITSPFLPNLTFSGKGF